MKGPKRGSRVSGGRGSGPDTGADSGAGTDPGLGFGAGAALGSGTDTGLRRDRGEARLQGDFAAEAQEIVEALSRALLDADSALKSIQTPHPDTVNEAFRATHTIKGLSSLFGRGDVAGFAHELEEILDALRMGRLDFSASLLDVLFEAVELLGKLIGEEGCDPAELEAFGPRLAALMVPVVAPPDLATVLQRLQLSTDLLSMLTEYEEHRLRESLAVGRRLFLVRSAFDVITIDEDLEHLRSTLKTIGEVITCLPSDQEVGEDRIGLDLLLTTERGAAEVRRISEALNSTVEELGRQAAPTPVPREAPTPVPIGRGKEPQDTPREGLRAMGQTVRVNIEKLDRLMNAVGELALVRSELRLFQRAIARGELDAGLPRNLALLERTFSRRLDELQRGILEVRMVPLSQVFDKLARVVRRLSREFDKQVAFYVSGGETEIDKLIVEELTDPLMHIIRNCIDHGVEDPITRTALGKPAEGMVALRAFPRGSHVVLEVEDDGAGIDPDMLLHQAILRGFLTPEVGSEMGRRDILNLIFVPGFSTREEVGPISGRGVGMDVVKTNLSKLSGLIDVSSTPGQGTRFRLTLPITLAIIRALLVKISDQIYAIPLSSVLEIVPVRSGQVATIEGREVLTLRGATLPLVRLEPVFGLPPPVASGQDGRVREYVVVVGVAQHRVGLVVNALWGQQDIVIKSLGKSLSGVPGVAGATELGGRRTVLVLDVASLVEEATRG